MNPQSHNLTLLIADFSQGDEKAFKALFDMQYRPLCYFANQMVDNLPEAEEIAAESFFKLFRDRKKFESFYQVKSYLYKVTRNACIDYLRKLKRQISFEAEMLYLVRNWVNGNTMDMVRSEILQEIYMKIEKLPKQQSQVVRYAMEYILDGKKVNVKEIAVNMNLEERTVRNHLRLGLLSLRRSLSNSRLLNIILFMIYWFYRIK